MKLCPYYRVEETIHIKGNTDPRNPAEPIKTKIEWCDHVASPEYGRVECQGNLLECEIIAAEMA